MSTSTQAHRSTGVTVDVVDPSTGVLLRSYEPHTDDQIESLVARGAAAAEAWGRVPLAERARAVSGLAARLRMDSSSLTDLVVAEMGKPTAEAAAEVEKSATTALYYAEQAETILAPERVDVGGASAWVAHEPMGLVLAVMPWNFPLWQVLRFAIPAVTAGNGVLLKHSPNVTGCALELQDLFVRAGFPPGLVTTLVISEPNVPRVTEALVADDRVAAVTLTGSNRAGAAVGAAAGRAAKKSVLELGGSDAFVVLDDADIETAATAAVRARFTNAGQSCVCAKRFVVHAAVADDFTRLFVRQVRALSVGDPRDESTRVGPLARDDLRDVVRRQVDDSLAAGATLLCGGRPMSGPGWFFQPTVLGDVRPGMAAFDEETFGPVAAITVAADDDEAATLAADTPFGLGLSVWTADPERALGIASRVTTGAVFVNAVVASDPRLPFGGTKRSGYGRELSAAGIREFTNTRTYWVATP